MRAREHLIDTETSGTVQFEYEDLEAVTTLAWSEADDSTDELEFSVGERSIGRIYELSPGLSFRDR